MIPSPNYKFLEVDHQDVDWCSEDIWLMNQEKIDIYREDLYHGISIKGEKYLCGDVDVPNAILVEEIYWEKQNDT